jgi:hypothetical protein
MAVTSFEAKVGWFFHYLKKQFIGSNFATTYINTSCVAFIFPLLAISTFSRQPTLDTLKLLLSTILDIVNLPINPNARAAAYLHHGRRCFRRGENASRQDGGHNADEVGEGR